MRPVLLLSILFAALPVAAAEPQNCASCHSDLTGKNAEPARLFNLKDVHAAKGLTCVSCHGGDAGAKDPQNAHGVPTFVAPHNNAEAIVAMCGKCHAGPMENFKKGPHHLAVNAKRRPDCSTCHGSHGIKAASIELISEPLCTTCHTLPQARRIYKALSDAEHEVESLDLQLAGTGNHVAERARLRAARTELRGHAHGLDLLVITRNAAKALETADDVRAKALPKEGGKAWGKTLRIAGGLIAAVMIALAGLWAFRWVRMRKLKLPVLKGKQLTLVLVAGGVIVLAGSIGAWKGYNYMEHDPKFCTSCHTMGSAYSLWAQSGHKNVDCHTCHIPNVVSNIHQLVLYTTERPDVVVKHAHVPDAICESCHTNKGGSKWANINETPGHRVHSGAQRIECTQCHAMSVHKFVPPKEACQTCHKKITLAAAGTMAEMHCMQCHPFMSPDAKRPLKPDRAVCLDCHAIRQVKGEVFPAKAPMQWDCGKCHKPHEKLNIGSAECLKCHEAMTEGVHRVKAHNTCTDCHKPHGWATTAESCTKCHSTIVAARHHPEPGKTCKDCHGVWDDEFKGAKPTKLTKLIKK